MPKTPYFIVLYLIITASLQAQVQSAQIVYNHTVIRANKAPTPSQTPEATNKFTLFSLGINYFAALHTSGTKNYLMHEDTLVCHHLDESDEVFNTTIQYDNDAFYLHPITAEKLAYNTQMKEHLFKDLTNKLKRKKNKAEEINGVVCEMYQSKIDDKSLTIYISPEHTMLREDALFENLAYNGKMIFKKEYIDKSKELTITTQIQSISELDNELNVFSAALEKKIQQLNLNESIMTTPLSVNAVAPKLYYESIPSEEYLPLYDFKNNGKYLLIEFWGTWCAPCLKAVPKIKAFQDTHGDKVNILSMAYKDTNLNKVKAKIKEKEMTWHHGMATEKIKEILNPGNNFPGMILLDDEMEVLYIGDPRNDFEKLVEMIKVHSSNK